VLNGATPPAELAATLEHRSGLLGLAGTADMREVLSRAEAGDEAARLARDVYIHRLRAGIAAMAAALGGLDTIVFTGGVGENSAEVRARQRGHRLPRRGHRRGGERGRPAGHRDHRARLARTEPGDRCPRRPRDRPAGTVYGEELGTAERRLTDQEAG
jgi:predicted NBD/HSP70 family sugar kinase